MHRLREDADFDSAMVFDEAVASQARQRLRAFQAAVASALPAGDDQATSA